MSMKIIKITWRDSAIYNSQGDADYPYQVSVFESVGFLLKENKDSTVIARDMIRDESRGVLIIPKENILTKVFIK